MRHDRQPPAADLGYALATLKYRWRWIAVPVLLFAAAGLAASLMDSARYVSKATLLVEPPRLSPDLAPRTGLADEVETLRLIERYALSHAVLADLSEGVFGGEASPAELRDRIRIVTQGGPVRGASGTPVTIEISFAAAAPDLAAQAANEIVSYILAEHMSRRGDTVDDALLYAADEADRLAGELAAAERRLNAFEQENQAALPASLSFRRTQRADLRDRLIEIDAESADLTSQLTSLDSGVVLAPDSEPAALAALRDEHAALSAVLVPNSPRLASLAARIAAIQANSGPPVAESSAERAGLEARLAGLARQNNAISAEIDAISVSISDTPRVAMELAAIERTLREAESRHDVALANRHKAETGLHVERMGAEGRIVVLEPAVPPDNTDAPARALLAGLGAFFGLFAGAVLLAARETFDTTLRRPADLERALDIEPFAILPILRHPRPTGSWPLALVHGATR